MINFPKKVELKYHKIDQVSVEKKLLLERKEESCEKFGFMVA